MRKSCNDTKTWLRAQANILLDIGAELYDFGIGLLVHFYVVFIAV